MLSDRLTASRECDAEIYQTLNPHMRVIPDDTSNRFYDPNKTNPRTAARYFLSGGATGVALRYTTSLDAAASLYIDKPAMIPSDPLECCRAALKQRGL